MAGEQPPGQEPQSGGTIRPEVIMGHADSENLFSSF